MALLRGSPYQQEWTLFWELSLQKLSLKNHCKEWALPERALTAGGCGGGPRLSGRSLQSGGGGRPCQGALTARRWGRSTTGAAALQKEGHPLAGRLEQEKRGTGPGRADSVSMVSFWSWRTGGPVSVLLPAASHPRPLLPSSRCSFLWLRLSLSHELTAPNGLQLPRYSSSSCPLLASDRTAHSASPPPFSTLPPPTLTAPAGSPEHWGVCLLAHTPWGWVSVLTH